MEIIAEELGEIQLDPEKVSIVKGLFIPLLTLIMHVRCIFEWCSRESFRSTEKGATIVTDTNMACVGINKPGLNKLGGKAVCFMADADVAERAKEAGSTRAAACMEKLVK